MPVLQSDQHTLAPAAQYLRALWAARLLYFIIVVACVGASLVITALLPKTYSSDAIISVRSAPRLESSGLLYDSVIASPGPPDQDRPEPENTAPRRFLRLLQATRTVTLAAQDAGVIDASTRLDERQIDKWVDADQVEKTDLLALTVSQPTPEAAQRFAEKLVARTIEFNRQQNTSADTRHLLAARVAHAEAVLAAAEKRMAELDGPGANPLQKAVRDRAALELDLARKAYVPLRRRGDAIDLLLAEQQVELYVADPPTLPIRPSFPRPVLNVSIGLILGILTATVVVIVRSIFAAPQSRPR